MITYREYCKIIREDWGTTSPIPEERYDFPDPLKNMNWIDFGLPSGTLWADVNLYNPDNDHGFWTWDDIMASPYKDYVPTKEQFKELIANCDRKWDDTSVPGIRVTSRQNKNTIFLSAEGWFYPTGGRTHDKGNFGNYWSATPYIKKDAYYLLFTDHSFTTDTEHCYIGQSVRLVKNKK